MDWRTVVAAAGFCLAVITFFLGQKSGLKKNAYEQGVKDTEIKNSIDNLANEIKKYAEDAVHRLEFELLKKDVEELKLDKKKEAAHDR